MTKETVSGARLGAGAWCSSASCAPDWNSAQCTGFSLSISAQGMPSMTNSGAGAICGHRYAAMAIPEVRTVMTRKHAIRRQMDENEWRIGDSESRRT